MPAPSFEEFCADFRQFRAVAGNVLETAEDGPLKQKLADLIKFVDQQFAQFTELYPQAMADLQARKAAVLQKVQEQRATLGSLQQQIAQAAAQPKIPRAATPRKPASIEVIPGVRLREELLDRFGRIRSEGDDQAIREVWEDWDWHGDHWDGQN